MPYPAVSVVHRQAYIVSSTTSAVHRQQYIASRTPVVFGISLNKLLFQHFSA
jgi:hypothetical protein